MLLSKELPPSMVRAEPSSLPLSLGFPPSMLRTAPSSLLVSLGQPPSMVRSEISSVLHFDVWPPRIFMLVPGSSEFAHRIAPSFSVTVGSTMSNGRGPPHVPNPDSNQAAWEEGRVECADRSLGVEQGVALMLPSTPSKAFGCGSIAATGAGCDPKAAPTISQFRL